MNSERLLNVAKALSESKAPNKFSMNMYAHECGTPACALGHYASRGDLQDQFRVDPDGTGTLQTTVRDIWCWTAFDGAAILKHFDIDRDQAVELFGDAMLDEWGCGSATTAIEAARYIEDFVARGGQ